MWEMDVQRASAVCRGSMHVLMCVRLNYFRGHVFNGNAKAVAGKT